MLRIRIRLGGRTHAKIFSIVVIEKSLPRQSKYIEKLGWYNPVSKEGTINKDSYDKWLSIGAKPSDRVCNLYKRLCLS